MLRLLAILAILCYVEIVHTPFFPRAMMTKLSPTIFSSTLFYSENRSFVLHIVNFAQTGPMYNTYYYHIQRYMVFSFKHSDAKIAV